MLMMKKREKGEYHLHINYHQTRDSPDVGLNNISGCQGACEVSRE
jgi:hypothetical protein